jgi:hypothetical protein
MDHIYFIIYHKYLQYIFSFLYVMLDFYCGSPRAWLLRTVTFSS